MSLFKLGNFILSSGERTDWVIDCNALSDGDIKAMVSIAIGILPPFGSVVATTHGDMRFVQELSHHSQDGGRLLIAQDVITNGNSMEEARDGRDAIGICMFARQKPPSWVKAVWRLDDGAQ